MAVNRQLAAIMFTDIEGYTMLMQEDEEKATLVRNRHREILQLGHQEFSGEIIQYYGDGTLSMFQSAVQAVECALMMQQAFRNPPHVPVRMGLHIGDIVHNEEGIFGDGVNLASRIESLGVAGSVLLSSKVNDEINNHPGLKTYSVGTYQLKNIKKPIEVYALDHEGLVRPDPDSLKGKTAARKPSGTDEKKRPGKSIAVLPFENMSNDPGQDYFSDGIAEEILNALSTLKDLKVANRSSAFQFNTKKTNLREIGRQLGVSTVLEGSVRRQGRQLRVTVQLVNVDDGFHLWSEKYDGHMDDIFAIQDKIANSTTEKLKIALFQNENGNSRKTNTTNTEAYELYLKGRYHANKRGVHIITGIHCFQLAIDLDPDFALAHAGLADSNLMAAFYALVPATQVIYKARRAAETAIALDPGLCEPYASLGCYYTCFEWNWREGKKHFLRSLELNPNYAQAHYWYGNLYLGWAKGDKFRSETHGRMAIELEPHSSICYSTFASILSTAGKFSEALEACNKALELDNTSFLAYQFKGWTLLNLKRYPEAVQAFEELMNISRRHPFAQNSLIIAYCTIWRFDKARELMNELENRSKEEFMTYTLRGISAGYLEDMDAAFAFLEEAYKEKEALLLSLKHEHWVPAALRQDARFDVLLEKIGFSEEE